MDASTERSRCTDCLELTSTSLQRTRAHPYLVFSGTSRATGAREFLCVLCRSTFSFEPHQAVEVSGAGDTRSQQDATAAGSDDNRDGNRPAAKADRRAGGCSESA